MTRSDDSWESSGGLEEGETSSLSPTRSAHNPYRDLFSAPFGVQILNAGAVPVSNARECRKRRRERGFRREGRVEETKSYLFSGKSRARARPLRRLFREEGLSGGGDRVKYASACRTRSDPARAAVLDRVVRHRSLVNKAGPIMKSRRKEHR